jgi:hypothetical protein
MRAVGVKYWAVLTSLLIAVSATTLHSLFIFMNNAASVFIAIAAAFDWHVRARNILSTPAREYCHCLCDTSSLSSSRLIAVRLQSDMTAPPNLSVAHSPPSLNPQCRSIDRRNVSRVLAAVEVVVHSRIA